MCFYRSEIRSSKEFCGEHAMKANYLPNYYDLLQSIQLFYSFSSPYSVQLPQIQLNTIYKNKIRFFINKNIIKSFNLFYPILYINKVRLPVNFYSIAKCYRGLFMGMVIIIKKIKRIISK